MSGKVTIATDKQRYAPADMITVAIANGLPSTIFAADHQPNCTTVALERDVAGGWQPQNPCRLMIATHLVSFGAGTVTRVQLSPLPPAVGSSPAWAPGIYRVAFDYRSSATALGATVYSASLVVA